MNRFFQLYEFAASVGALEGFVYRRPDLQAEAIAEWVENLGAAYKLIPGEVLKEIQPSLDKTVGRAVKSVSSVLGEEHVLTQKLKAMLKGTMPSSPDDFQKKKWFQKQSG